MKTCPGYCELCCPWTEHPPRECSRTRSCSRSRSPSPPTHNQQRCSRRDYFDCAKYDEKLESIDEKIERIRRELNASSLSKCNRSTETIDCCRRPLTPPVQRCAPYKQHYDAPKPCCRSRSRPRSSSSHRWFFPSDENSFGKFLFSFRASSLTREPWRSASRNDYPWRDSHLPAYREATLARSQTSLDDVRKWDETAHQRSHQNTCKSRSYYSNKDYVYRPPSDAEAQKWYTQTTGKNATQEVHQALYGKPATTATTTTYCTPSQNANPCHSFYSDVPSTKTHHLHKVDATPHHNLYGCNDSCLHVIPKQGSTLNPPYLKILNAPVTYIHWLFFELE